MTLFCLKEGNCHRLALVRSPTAHTKNGHYRWKTGVVRGSSIIILYIQYVLLITCVSEFPELYNNKLASYRDQTKNIFPWQNVSMQSLKRSDLLLATLALQLVGFYKSVHQEVRRDKGDTLKYSTTQRFRVVNYCPLFFCCNVNIALENANVCPC